MKRRVLLCVDDEEVVRVGLKDQLRRQFGQDFAIEAAESGEAALEILDELREDSVEVPVILSDHIMPGLKGDELLVRVHQQLPRTLKILLTGQASADAVGNAVNNANLYRYISKPWEQADLMLTVTEAIRSHDQDQRLEEQNRELVAMNGRLQAVNQELERHQKILGAIHQCAVSLYSFERLDTTLEKILALVVEICPTALAIIHLQTFQEKGDARTLSLHLSTDPDRTRAELAVAEVTALLARSGAGSARAAASVERGLTVPIVLHRDLGTGWIYVEGVTPDATVARVLPLMAAHAANALYSSVAQTNLAAREGPIFDSMPI